MARTTEAAVRKLLAGSYDPSIDLVQHIDTANALVEWLHAKDTDAELSSAMLELIERWLACYYYGSSDQFYTSKSTDGASGSFEPVKFREKACDLDVTGRLAQRFKETEDGGRKQASLTWLGQRPSNQTDYVDRD